MRLQLDGLDEGLGFDVGALLSTIGTAVQNNAGDLIKAAVQRKLAKLNAPISVPAPPVAPTPLPMSYQPITQAPRQMQPKADTAKD